MGNNIGGGGGAAANNNPNHAFHLLQDHDADEELGIGNAPHEAAHLEGDVNAHALDMEYIPLDEVKVGIAPQAGHLYGTFCFHCFDCS